MLSLSSGKDLRTDIRARDHAPLYRVVYDGRFGAGVEFADSAARRGVDTERISGDITDFWFHDLSRRWRESPVAIAGLTAHGPLFCLERLAWDHGLRVVFLGEHRFDAGRALHSITGTSLALRSVSTSALASPDWARHLGRILTGCDPNQQSDVAMTERAVGVSAFSAHEPLFSWLIASRVTAAGVSSES